MMWGMADLPLGYPREWEADVVLRDGSVARVRPIRPDDADGLRRFHAGQSEESIYLRFFAPIRELSDRDVERFTHIDYHERVALVVTLREEIIGIGRYDVVSPGSAEVAFNISDHHQGRGIGSVLLEHLAAIAQELGVGRFVAEVLPQNRKMLAVFSEAGYEVSRHIEDGIVSVSFDIHPTDQSQAVRASREHRAEAASMRSIMHPRSIAVVGASRREESVGHVVLANLQAAGFTGSLHVVHPEADRIRGIETVRSLDEIEEELDLVIVAVPAAAVLEVVDASAAKGVRALLVVSSGFAEASQEGYDAQVELLRRARGDGMRVIGPTSFGIINNDEEIRLNATLADRIPPRGHLGMMAQSGALGISLLASAARRNLGISTFISAGNRVDVSGNDVMQYWIDDPETSAVGLYMESMGNPRKFSRIARHLARSKPVIAVKSGFSSYGVPPGHRVRATQSRPKAFSELLKQSGVIRVSNIHELFDVAQLVVHQPIPQGNRVAVVTNSAALSALTAGAAVNRGLKVTRGPLALAADASAAQFAEALGEAFADKRVDSVIAAFVPPLVDEDEQAIEAVRSLAAHPTKPIVATFLGLRGVDGGTRAMGVEADRAATDGRALPVYSTPEDAVRALEKATKYGAWRSRDHGLLVAPIGIDRAGAERVVEQVLAESPEGRDLTEVECAELLAAYGIVLWQRVSVHDEEGAVAAAEALGYPVVLKSTSPLVRHSTGSASIRVDIDSPAAVRTAYASLVERLPAVAAESLVCQRMATPGIPCVVGSAEDPLFGPIVQFSLAGPPTELLGDISYRVPPLTDVEVSELISSVRAAPLLHGHRGAAPVNRAALSDLVARVSVLADHLPEVARLRLEPVNSHPDGIEVLGAEIRLRRPEARSDSGRRSLT